MLDHPSPLWEYFLELGVEVNPTPFSDLLFLVGLKGLFFAWITAFFVFFFEVWWAVVLWESNFEKGQQEKKI
jgi:hypothetical protein